MIVVMQLPAAIAGLSFQTAYSRDPRPFSFVPDLLAAGVGARREPCHGQLAVQPSVNGRHRE
jgi:hypothetical protein